ncbi:MAG TPA: hypothetical protein VMM12_16680 [Longimicrobiales bacterium]|nr:hypothetical protein [Longimicrobiales bacterium]
MKRISTKTAAEAILRELPSILGAYVSEDLEGHPREIHLLVRAGPEPGGLARDIRNLLEERLGIPIDQRVISIAQLARDAVPEADTPDLEEENRPRAPRGAGGRPIFAGLESTVSAGHVRVAVRLEWRGETAEGTAEAADTQPGRARAAATATLNSAMEAAWNEELRFELDFASLVQALDGEYVLVSVLGMSPRLGRRPLPLVGAQPVEGDVEAAAALATLKAINRVLSLALDADSERPGSEVR